MRLVALFALDSQSFEFHNLLIDCLPRFGSFSYGPALSRSSGLEGFKQKLSMNKIFYVRSIRTLHDPQCKVWPFHNS